ncbi:MAG: NAD-dependent epimerase/dehydratase family protein, partial [uncultured Friedmanniella sp.]
EGAGDRGCRIHRPSRRQSAAAVRSLAGRLRPRGRSRRRRDRSRSRQHGTAGVHGADPPGCQGRPWGGPGRPRRLRPAQRPGDRRGAAGGGGCRDPAGGLRLLDGGLWRGRLRLRRTWADPPAATPVRRAGRRPVRPALPGLRSRPRARPGARERAAGSAQRLRRDEGARRAPRRRLVPRDRRLGRRPAVPQRLRSGHAEQHPVRRGRLTLRQCAVPRRGPPRVRGWAPAPELRPRPGRGRRRGRRVDRRPPRRRHATQRRLPGCDDDRRDGRRDEPGTGRSGTGGDGGVPAGGRPARHRGLLGRRAAARLEGRTAVELARRAAALRSRPGAVGTWL